MSDSLQPNGLYSPWNSPGQNTGVGILFNPGIEPRSSALQADSLSPEAQGKLFFPQEPQEQYEKAKRYDTGR